MHGIHYQSISMHTCSRRKFLTLVLINLTSFLCFGFCCIGETQRGTNKSSVKKKTWIIVSLVCLTVVVTVGIAVALFLWRKKYRKKGNSYNRNSHFHFRICLSWNIYLLWDFVGSMKGHSESSYKYENEKDDLELPLFDFATIARATDNFSSNNKLGEGGFGSVYKVTADNSSFICSVCQIKSGLQE